jgi:hypothetical protein
MYLALQNASLNGEDTRVAWHDGRPHLVTGVVAVQEQVLKGELLPQAEIEASASSFNGRPLPVGHPVNEDTDEFVSANDPETWDSEVVGKLFDAREDDAQLIGETWIDIKKSIHLGENKAARYAGPLALIGRYLEGGLQSLAEGDGTPDSGVGLDMNVVNSLSELADELGEDAEDASENANDALEVSTAYWYQPDGQSGTHNGEEYKSRQLNVKPDHLALLPTQIGECSVEDGCGAPRANEAGGSKVLADGGNPADDAATGNASPPDPSDEQSFAFASDEDADGNTVGGATKNDGGGNGSGDGMTDDDAKGLLGGLFETMRSFGYDTPEVDDFETDENAGNCGCDHETGNNRIMNNDELASHTGLTVEQIEEMSDPARSALESEAEETLSEDGDGDDGAGDGGGDGSQASGNESGGGSDGDDPDGTGNSSGALFDSREEMGEFIVETMKSRENQKEAEEVIGEITTLNEDADADELRGTSLSFLKAHRDALKEAQNGGAGGGGYPGGASDTNSGFAGQVGGMTPGGNDGDEDDGWGSEPISANHAGEGAIPDGGETEDSE